MTIELDVIDHVHVHVSDRAESEKWYARVPGFNRIAALECWAADGGSLTISNGSGSMHLALFEGRPVQNTTIAFRVDADGLSMSTVHHWSMGVGDMIHARYFAGIVLIIALLFAPAPIWSQTGKPLLSEEIRAAIEAGGPQAAKQRMTELYPAGKDNYEVDTQGLTTLAMSYMQAGNHEAANAVMELLPMLLADMMANSPYGAQMQQMAREQPETAAVKEPASAAIAPTARPGPAITPPDTNRGLVVDDAIEGAGETTLLFHTFPQRGDPAAGSDCPLNFYTTRVRPGSGQALAEPAASEICGFTGTHGRLLENGDLLLVSRSRLQRWRQGKLQSSGNLAELPAMGRQGYDASRAAHLVAIAPTGETVLAIPGGGYMPQEFDGASFLLVAVSAEGKQRWQLPVYPQQGGSLNQIWLGADGTLLTHVMSIDAQRAGGGMGTRHVLQIYSGDGRSLGSVEIARDSGPSMHELLAGGEKGIESALLAASAAIAESVQRIAAQPAPGGGFYVLIERHSDAGDRYGHFLYHIGAGGELLDQQPLNRLIRPYRLEQWVDFSIRNGELYLLGSVLADQAGVNSRRTRYRQSVVGRIDLERGFREARLVPLDRRYLEPAMNAGDEEIQYLENMPGGDPVLLSWIGTRPLAVTLGYLARRQVLRIDEVGEELAVFARAR